MSGAGKRVNVAGDEDPDITSLGRSLLKQMDQIEGGRSRLGPSALYNRLMALCMADATFKNQLFRLVDVLPALEGREEVAAHFVEYLQETSENLPAILRLPVRMGGRVPRLVAPVVRRNVTSMARQFMIEDDPRQIVKRLGERQAKGLRYTVDLLGEKVLSEQEAQLYSARVQQILALLASSAGGRPPAGEDLWPTVNLSLKISALDSQIRATDPEGAIARLKDRLRPIVRQARKSGAFINFDMEHHQLKQVTLRLFCALLEEEEFRDFEGAGIAIQAYLKESERDLRELVQWARRGRRRITVRLVKGAYWDYERVMAQQKSWPVPVFERKAESDQSFERLAVFLLENAEHTVPAFATHNVRSIAHAIVQADRLGVPVNQFEFQMLYGMADSLKEAVLARGFGVREYCPVGELLPGMAYLVRRLLENSANEGFLASRFSGRISEEELLRSPAEVLQSERTHPICETPGAVVADFEFKNAPPADFTQEEEREAFRRALGAARKKCGRHYRMVIGGEEVDAPERLASCNPAFPNTVVGTTPRGQAEHAHAAVAAAVKAAAAWAATAPATRAGLVDGVAELLEKRRHEFAALEVLEVGKPWVEADADVCEAIDFCRFYAETMRSLERPRQTQAVAGEENYQVWRSRGVGVVIAPWNFPLAILCGMTVATLVTGNTVILKPAEQSPVVAAWFVEVLREAGIPPGVVNLVTGMGEEVGEVLVNHPAVSVIAFTGSREVGLRIWEAAGRTHPSQRHLKKAVCEMGGKNALIIDEDADLDEAVEGAVYSAFGYQGQKCSALSRLIILEKVYDRFLERFIEAVRSLTIGDPSDPGVVVGPLIDDRARQKVRRFVSWGKEEARLVFEGTIPNAIGYFVGPVVFADVPRGSGLFREEIFGPVVAVTKVNTLEEAIEVANDSEYGLTGGIYSRSPARVEAVKGELQAGNLYINRPITGAIVGRQPFGGYKMSGGGTKAGGREYLLQFVVPQVISENTIRHGFVPEE
jgi:RHH-type transcriptional regulator, proline utilization regulon repressor / proline dehydrogenase / delta 1-pyrroline-5-carboxylate dehydrogenase